MNKYQYAIDELKRNAWLGSTERLKELKKSLDIIQCLIDSRQYKPISILRKSGIVYYCGCCGTIVKRKYRYCYKCGSSIDWRKDE